MSHHCHVPGCPVKTPPRLLTCPPHWAMVDPPTQREVYRTVKLRDMRAFDATWAPWWRAAHRAIAQCMLADGGDPAMVERWLARQLAFADKLEARP